MSTWTTGVASKASAMDQSTSIQKVQAGVVMHHYVRSQIYNINKYRWKQLVEPTIKALKQRSPNLTQNQIDAQYIHMQKRLQSADLTINFTASGFFSAENKSTSYQQMYERSLDKNGYERWDTDSGVVHKTVLKGNAQNQADVRVMADNRATFGKNVLDAKGNFNAAFNRVGQIMHPGKLDKTGNEHEFLTSNAHFNPRSKQVFAALNFGRRPHSSAAGYGMSYMVLSNKFKTNALYFAGDTFMTTMRNSADDQVSYDLLPCIYGLAAMGLKNQLYQSCVLSGSLPDEPSLTYEMPVLIEAHLFEPLTFAGNIEEVHLCPKDTRSSAPAQGAAWQNIVDNARKFCVKHGASLILNMA